MARPNGAADGKSGDSETVKLSSFESCFPQKAFSTYNEILSRRVLKPSESQQNIIVKKTSLEENQRTADSLLRANQIENVPPPSARKNGTQTNVGVQTSPSSEAQSLRTIRKVPPEKLFLSFPPSGSPGSKGPSNFGPEVTVTPLSTPHANLNNPSQNSPINNVLIGNARYNATQSGRSEYMDPPKRPRVYKKKTMNTNIPHLGQNVLILNRTIQRGNVLYTEVRHAVPASAVSASAVPVSAVSASVVPVSAVSASAVPVSAVSASAVPVSVVSQSFSHRNGTAVQEVRNNRPQAMGIITDEPWNINYGSGNFSSASSLQLKELPHLSTEDVEDIFSTSSSQYMNFSFGNSL